MIIKSIIGSRVLVEVTAPKTQTASGIYIPGTSVKNPLEGKVLLVGPRVQALKVNDTVKYYEHCGTPLQYEGKDCLFLEEKTEIVAIL